MAQWRKVVVSGSSAVLNEVSASGNIVPKTTDGSSLGTTALQFSDLFLGEGAVINWDSGDFTATQTNNLLALSGGNTRVDKLEIDGANDSIDVSTDMVLTAAADITLAAGGANVKPNANNTIALGVSGTAWSDLFLGDEAVINFNAGNMTLTHASNEVQVNGGDLVLEGTNKVGFGGAPSTDYIQKDTDLKIYAAGDIVLIPGGGDIDIVGDIEMATGELITWVADDQFITGVDGTITVDGDDNVNIIADTEVDITSDALVDVNAVNLDLYASTSASIISPSLTFGNDEVTFNGTDSDDFVAIKRGSQPGLLRLYEGSGTGDNYVAIQAGNVAGASDIDYTFTWPVDDGADGQILKTDGSGVLTWVTDQTTSGSATNSNVFGTPVDDQNVVMTFDSYQTNGVFSWMENEDYFKFDNDIFIYDDKKVEFGSTANYIHLTSSNLKTVAAADAIIDAVTDIQLDADGQDIFFMHNADIFGSATKAATNELVLKSGTSAAVEFRSGDTEIKGDIIVAGNDIKSGSLSSATTAITLSSADVTVAGDLTVTGNDLDFGNGATIVNTSTSLLTITEATTALSGDLTVTGNDITMGTNTAGFVMVADGTNFNPVAISGDVAITSAGVATVTGSTTNAALTAGVGISASGTFTGLTARTLALALDELTEEVIATGDHLAFNDSGDDGQHKETIDDLFGIGPALTTEAVMADGDYLIFLDGSATGVAKKEALADLVGVMAGTVTSTGISDASSVLSLDIQNMTASTTIVDADLVVIDDGANGTLRKMTRAHFIESAALDAINIDGGNIDGATIATSDVTVGSGKTLDVSGGTLTTSAAQKLAIVQGVGANTDIGSYSLTAQTLVSDVTTGTPPLTVSSTTNVPNLNASSLSGATFAAPGAIGGGTAAAGTFAAIVGTSLDLNGNMDLSTGTVDVTLNAAVDALNFDSNTLSIDATNNFVGIGNATPDVGLHVGDDTGTPTHATGTAGVFVEGIAEIEGGLYLSGDINITSDVRYKKNINSIPNALEKLSKLNPVNYNWRQDEFSIAGFNDKKQWGFIAQEVEKVMPELVSDDINGFKSLNYTGVIPLLTKAMQEQQTEMEKQQKEIDQLKAQLQSIMKMLDNDMSDKTDDKKADDNEKPVKLSMVIVK